MNNAESDGRQVCSASPPYGSRLDDHDCRDTTESRNIFIKEKKVRR